MTPIPEINQELQRPPSTTAPLKLAERRPRPAAPKQLDPQLYAWEYHAGFETAASYNAFQNYLALGAKRSLALLSQTLRGGPGANRGGKKKVPSQIEEWSSKYHWVERATAWDNHLATLRYKTFEDRVTEMAQRQADDFFEFQKLAMESFQVLRESGVRPTSFLEIAKIFTIAVRGEQDAMGIVDIPPPPPAEKQFHFENLSTAEISTMIELQKKLTTPKWLLEKA